MNASIRLLSALVCLLSLSACASAGLDAAGSPRTYREPLGLAEPTLRSGQESPTVLRSHERARPPHEREGVTAGRLTR